MRKIDGQRRAYADPAKRKYYAARRCVRYARYIAGLSKGKNEDHRESY